MTATHRYAARLTWSGSTGDGYDAFTRHHTVSPGGRPELTMSADPHFHGDAALVNPEELLVTAASSCQLLSFLAVAARARLDVIGYTDEATGVMPAQPAAGERLSVTEIRLHPRIVLATGSRADRLRRLVEVAHRECFVAASLRARMTIEAEAVIDGGVVATARVAD